MSSRLLGYLSLLPRVSARCPRRVLLFVALIALGCASGITRLKLRTDGHALISPTAPEVLTDKRVRGQFGIRDQIVVVIRPRAATNIFNGATIELVRRLTAEFKKLSSSAEADVMSLATEPGFRLRPGTMGVQTLLETPLVTGEQLEQLRGDLQKLKLYTETLVSKDGKSTIILVGVPEGEDRFLFYQRILRVISEQKNSDQEIGVTGALVAESLFGLEILQDLGVPGPLLHTSFQAPPLNRQESRYQGGFHQLLRFVSRHLGFVPLTALVMMMVLLICFRSLPAAIVPLPGIAATMVLVFGLMGWTGVPVYLTTAIMPVLLTVISFTNDIYLFSRYFSLLREKPGTSPLVLIDETFEALVAPVAITSLSAVVGFLSFAASPLGPVRSFGIFAGFGAFCGLFLSLTVIPALLVLIPASRFISNRRKPEKGLVAMLADGFETVGGVIQNHRWWVIGLTLFVMALTPLGIRRLVVQDSWTNGFAPESEFRRVTRQVNQDFLGMHQLFVSLHAPETLRVEIGSSAINGSNLFLPAHLVPEPISISGSTIKISPRGQPATAANTWQSRIEMADYIGSNILVRVASLGWGSNFWTALKDAGDATVEIPVRTQLDPQMIRRLEEFEAFIRQQSDCSVGGVIGPPDYLATIRFIARGAGAEARGLPETAVDAGILWDYYRVVMGHRRLRQIVDEGFSTCLITVFLKDANYVDTARLMDRIRNYERQNFSGGGIKLEFAGDVAVSQSLIQSIVTTQMQSLAWSALGIFAVIAWLGGSWLRAILSLLPSLLAIAFKFAVMGWMNIPLGVATSMFAAMTLGIGVNCAIHFFEGYDRVRLGNKPAVDPCVRSLRLTGPAALINAIAVSLGFGVLMTSSMPANSRLGILLVLGLLSCAALSLSLIPALIGKAKGHP